MANFLNEEDELEQSMADAQNRKAFLNAAGGVTDALTNVRSASEIALGQGRPQNRFGDSFRAAAENVGDPMDKKAKAMAFIKAKRENALGADQEAQQMALKDPNSPQSKARKLIAQKYGVQVTPEMSGYDVDQIIDSKKMLETEASANVNFDKQKRLAAINHGYDIEKERAKANTPKGQFDALPEDKKLTITELSKKNAAKVAIKNQIDAVMVNWDKLTEDQQVAQGRQLLKTLNSAEGADAIGAEEAKRLGGKLEFAMGNLFNSNPVQFGRDLKGFAEQAKNTSKALDGAMGANKAIIDESYGRPVEKQVVKQQVNKRTGETRVVYADGTTKVINNTAGR